MILVLDTQILYNIKLDVDYIKIDGSFNKKNINIDNNLYLTVQKLLLDCKRT